MFFVTERHSKWRSRKPEPEPGGVVSLAGPSPVSRGPSPVSRAGLRPVRVISSRPGQARASREGLRLGAGGPGAHCGHYQEATGSGRSNVRTQHACASPHSGPSFRAQADANRAEGCLPGPRLFTEEQPERRRPHRTSTCLSDYCRLRLRLAVTPTCRRRLHERRRLLANSLTRVTQALTLRLHTGTYSSVPQNSEHFWQQPPQTLKVSVGSLVTATKFNEGVTTEEST